MICVPNLKQGIEAYTRIGFGIQPGGDHTSGGTHNAIAFFKDDYLELLAVREGQQPQAGAALLEFLAKGGGLRYVALQSDDLAADVAAMRTRGVDVSDPDEGGRRSRDAGLGRSRSSTRRAAWTRRRSGWRITECHRPRAASATRASRRCWSSQKTPVASTSACSAPRPSRDAPLNHAFLAKLLQLFVAVAEQPAVDLGVVLAEQRRADHLGGRRRHPHRVRGHRVFAAPRMLQLGDH